MIYMQALSIGSTPIILFGRVAHQLHLFEIEGPDFPSTPFRNEEVEVAYIIIIVIRQNEGMKAFQGSHHRNHLDTHLRGPIPIPKFLQEDQLMCLF